ncbi:hypothetical protein KKG31_05075 [Patescibacteria group bacterium]|nr:hypothetical protein [Patescibacteria group bacterium]
MITGHRAYKKIINTENVLYERELRIQEKFDFMKEMYIVDNVFLSLYLIMMFKKLLKKV